MIAYVKHRTGHDVTNSTKTNQKNYLHLKLKKLTSARLTSKLTNLWILFVTSLLPKAFREQNVSFCSIGEKHAWMWDFYTLANKLIEVGFRDVVKVSFQESTIEHFPLMPLDKNPDNTPRKGYCSLYIEAVK